MGISYSFLVVDAKVKVSVQQLKEYRKVVPEKSREMGRTKCSFIKDNKYYKG